MITPTTPKLIQILRENKTNRVYVVKATKVSGNIVTVDEAAEVKFVPKPESSEHEGPVIWDPFEQIRQQNQKSVDHLDVKGRGRKSKEINLQKESTTDSLFLGIEKRLQRTGIILRQKET